MRHIRKHLRGIALALLALVFASSFLVSGLIARMRASADNTETGSATVAIMADTVTQLFNVKCQPGYSKVIPITITNYSGSAVCEVSQSYSYSIERVTEDLPLEIAVYRDAACQDKIPDANGLYEGTSTFTAGEKSSETVYLKVTWPDSKNDPSYAFEVDCLRVIVYAEQID